MTTPDTRPIPPLPTTLWQPPPETCPDAVPDVVSDVVSDVVPDVVPNRLRVARLLLLLEVVVAAVTAAEAAAVTALGFSLPAGVLLTGALAVLLAVQARQVGRGRVTRWVRVVQVVLLVAYGVDLVIGAFTGTDPLLVAFLVRFVLPVTVLVLVRRGRSA